MEGMASKPHAVMVPLPTPGHMNPMLNLAKLLHSENFRITFVLTDYTHHRLLRSGGPDPLLLDARQGFRFVVLPDGLPVSSNREWIKQVEEVGMSLRTRFPAHFRRLLAELGEGDAVTCVIAGFMSSALQVAEELGILKILFWTSSACGLMGTLQIGELVSRGYVPLKDEACLRNGYLDTELEWVPGMSGIRLRDITRFIRTTHADDLGLQFEREEAEIGFGAWAVILNTFDVLEHQVVSALRAMFPRLYTLGSVSALARSAPSNPVHLNLWREDGCCLDWLDGRRPSSVLYVNFGSLTVITTEQLMEFAWGLAASGHPFLWIIRPDLLSGDSTVILSQDFAEQTRARGYLTSWCSQEKVLAHPSVAGFLTHAGWNSVVESIWNGVPMLCWPVFAEQPTNCRYLCGEWGVGMEIQGEVRRDEVEALVRELMGGRKGGEMRRRAGEWKKRARMAVAGEGGSSHGNLERMVEELRMEEQKKKNMMECEVCDVSSFMQ